jgi:hypothetical protein
LNPQRHVHSRLAEGLFQRADLEFKRTFPLDAIATQRQRALDTGQRGIPPIQHCLRQHTILPRNLVSRRTAQQQAHRRIPLLCRRASRRWSTDHSGVVSASVPAAGSVVAMFKLVDTSRCLTSLRESPIYALDYLRESCRPRHGEQGKGGPATSRDSSQRNRHRIR